MVDKYLLIPFPVCADSYVLYTATGHGALTLALKGEPGSWCSVSAFAPICHPSKPSPWGEKAFKAYLGSVEAGKDYDATELIQKPGKAEMFDDILIDEGTADEFGQGGQLLLEDFEEAAKKVGQKLTVRRQQGFDHSYHFIATFIADHVVFHAKKLRKTEGALAAKIAKQTFDAMAAAGTAGKPIECKAMVARGPKQPLTLETITVDTPREGEVRVKVIANALCHTDIYTLDGHDPEGLFPCILGMISSMHSLISRFYSSQRDADALCLKDTKRGVWWKASVQVSHQSNLVTRSCPVTRPNVPKRSVSFA